MECQSVLVVFLYSIEIRNELHITIKQKYCILFHIKKVNLRIGYEDGKKYKSTPIDFIVLRPDWPDYYSDLVLGMPWFQENGATLDICNSKLLLNDNFTIPFKKVKYEPNAE